MKKLSAILCILCTFALNSFGAGIPIWFTNQTMIGTSDDTVINIKAKNNPTIWNGNYFRLPPNGTNLTTVGGVATINLVPGDYTAAYAGIPQSWTLHVTNSLTPLNAADITGNLLRFDGVRSVTGSGGIVTAMDANGVVNVDGSGVSGGPGGGTGNVTGPNSSTIGEIPFFDQNTGQHLGRSGIQYTNVIPWGLWKTNVFGSAAFTPASNYDPIGAALAVQGYAIGVSNQIWATTGRAYNVLSNSVVGDGVTDDTAAIQNVSTNGGVLRFDSAHRFLTSGITLTNNTYIDGQFAKFILKPGVTNAAVFTVPPGVTNVVFNGVRIDGLDYSTINASRNYSSNRVGISMALNSPGSILFNVTVKGLDYGVKLIGDHDGTGVFEVGQALMFGINCYSNVFGFYAASTNSNDATEYFAPTQLRVVNNVYGAFIGGGNISLVGAVITENLWGVLVDGSFGNPAHGCIGPANLINHNNRAILIANLTGGQGELIKGNQIRATATGDSIVISNSATVVVTGNMFGGTESVQIGVSGVAGSSRGPNFIFNNSYSGTWGNAPGFKVYDRNNFSNLITDNTSNAQHWVNFSYDTSGDNDRYPWNPWWTNMAAMPMDGSLFSNLNASAISSGTVPPANLGSGTSISGKFLRGDSTWQTIAGGGDMLAANNLSDVTTAATALHNIGGLSNNWTGTITSAGLHITVGETNDSLTAGSMLKADANKKIVSATLGTDYGLGTITGIDVAQQGYTSSGGLVTGSGTVTLTQNADKNHLGFSETNINKLAATNAILGASTGIDATNVFQVNTLAGPRKVVVNTNGDVWVNGNFMVAGNQTNGGTLTVVGNITAPNLLSATGLNSNAVVVTDPNTNLTNAVNSPGVLQNNGNGTAINFTNKPTLDLGNSSNSVAWTHEGTTTNITATFNGTIQTFTATNGPTLFFHFAGANGSISYKIISTNFTTLAFDWQPKWLTGSNNVCTNCVLSFTSYGGTNTSPHNQIEAALRENQ